MRRTVLTLMLVVTGAYTASACLTCGCASKKAAAKKAEHGEHHVTTEQLAKIVASKENVTILDARHGKWDDGRRVPGAKSLSPKATAEQAAALIPSKDAQVVTYCTNLKCPASKMLAGRLKELGYKNVNEYAHGIEGWAEAGNKVEKVK